MEVYILDDLLRRTAVIDRFESMIWTERWRDVGDFELVVPATPAMRNLLRTGKQLVITESDRIMEVDFVEDKRDGEGRKVLTASGLSLEALLDQRVATEGIVGFGESSDWVLTNTPGGVARHLFQKICVEGILSPGDIIPFIKPGTLYPPDSISEDQTLYQMEIPISTLLEAIKKLCEQYNLGFRLVRNQDKSELYFDIYAGNNRTTQQSTHAPVIFSPELDNMKNTTEVNSTKDYRNVAYVFSKNGSEIVYSDTADAETAGFKRRVMFVDANDVDDEPGPVLQEILRLKGWEALVAQRPLTAFDGEIGQYSEYKYGRDYNLGDLVEMRNADGATNNMRVTEQIFVSDSEGERSYPTLAVDSYIMPGTWDSWGNDTWDGGGEEFWDDDE